MASAASSLGYEYLAVTDHSESLRIANGLSTERVLRQIQATDRWNRSNRGPRVLKGIEVDILPDGSLDLPDSVLAQLDWVVASIHSSMAMPEHQMMRRLEKAIENPWIDAIGHPTGRLLGKPGQVFYHREPYAVDVERLLKLCVRHQVGLEINCFPERMDLSSDWALAAAKAGVPLHLGTDAHAMQHLELMRFGVDIARRAGLSKTAIRNASSSDSLKESRHRPGRRKAVGRRIGAFGLVWDDRPRTFARAFAQLQRSYADGTGLLGSI